MRKIYPSVLPFLAIFCALLLPLSAAAQETTSAIRGKVINNQGEAAVAASVVLEDTRTGMTRRYTTNASGTFLATNLPVGGPYRVTVDGVKSVIVEYIELGDTYNLTMNLQEEAALEEVVVVGQYAEMVNIAAGPAATFTQRDIETAVSINRDIADVYGFDPRLNVDNQDDGFALNCGGQHPRFNSITLDGVSYNDRFGLNDNGYSTATGMPFPFDGIQQIAVELAPFDVTYGGFSACNINSVTRSGSNEFHGNLWYDYTSDKLRGDSLGRFPDRDFSSPSYTQDRKGFSIGGPILKDRLFFFAAYEDSSRPRFLARGYDGSGVGEEREWLSKADYDRVVDIAQNIYGYDPGGMPGDGSAEDEKYMLRLDWNVTEKHNATFIYNYYDGFQDRDSDGDPDEFEFANHFYVKGAESETFTLMFTSQWTDRFSTDFFYSQNEMNDSQVTVGPKDFGDFQIEHNDGTIYLGADDSRQANSLATESEYFKISAQYLIGNHVLTAGYESEEVDIFNIFVQHSRGGEWDFYGIDRDGPDAADCASLTAAERFARSDCDVSGIDQFELGRPSQVYYGSGGGTNNPLDAAAMFGNTLHTAYLQDEMFFDSLNLTVVAGLRYDWFSSSDRPNYNQNFHEKFGIRNDANLDGVDLLMPRIGFTWEATDTLTVSGGIGLYSGGNPNVWISNAWSNDGLTNAQVRLRNFDGSDSVFGDIPMTGPNPGYDIPQELYDEVAAVTPEDGLTGSLVLIDPDYEQPSQWKFALGANWDTPFWDINASIDYLHTEWNDPAYYVDISQEIQGYTAAGTPIYDYMFGSRSGDNFMLTNSRFGGSTDLVSLILNKNFDSGLDLSFGYAYTDAEDVSPMTSSVAASNFDNLALLDLNDPRPGTSNYVVPNRFTLRARYGYAFFGDYETRFTLYGTSSEGQPGTYVMFSDALEGDGFFGRHLLYVPDGAEDPNVVFDPSFDQEAFFAWVEKQGLNSGFQKRNGKHAKWTTRFDLRVDQEFPLFGAFRGRAFMYIYNLGNLINDNWGEVWDSQFFNQQVIYGDVDDSGRFVYESFRERDINYFRQQRSLWEIRVGVEINF
jgi:outer membrane receptor for ferrienterochelin and colicin